MAEPRGTVVGKLIYLITGDESALTTSMDKARKNLKAFGQEMDRVGGRMTTFITLPLVAAGAAAIKFATQMEASQETAQKFSKAMDDLKAAAASLVSSFLPTIRGILDWVSRTAQAISQWDDGTKRLVLTMAGLLAAIGPVMKIMGLLTTILSANPYVLIAAAVVTLTAAVAGWAIASNAAKNEQANLAKQLQQTNELIDEQAIALNEERRIRASGLITMLTATVLARQQELDVVQTRLQQIRNEVAADTRLAAARSQELRTLVAKEETQRRELAESTVALKTQQTILQETERLAKSVADRKLASAAATGVETVAIKEKTLAQREEIIAEEDAALSSRILAEMALARSQAEAEATRQTEANLARLQASYATTAQFVLSTVGPMFEAIGTALVDSARGWAAFKQAAKDAIATVLQALAKMWATEGAAMLVPGITFNPAGAIGLFAQAAAALVASGFVKALASGGSFTTSGPQLLMVGDNPGGQEQVSVTPTSSPNIGGGAGEMIRVQVNLAERPILDVITRAARGKRLLIDGGAIV